MRRLLGRVGLAGAVLLLGLGPVGTSHADTPAPTPPAAADASGSDQAQLNAMIEKVRGQLAESSESMVRAYADLQLAEQALPAARETVSRTRALLAEARARQERTARQRAAAQVRYMLSSQAAEAQATAVATQRDRIGQLAREAYQGGGDLGAVSVLLEARSPGDLAERLASLRAVASSQRSALAGLRQVQDRYGTRTENLALVRDDLAAADERAQQDLATVTRLAAAATSAESRVSALVAARKDAMARAAQAARADEAAAAQQAGASSQLQAQLAAAASQAGASGGTAPVTPGTLAWPVPGTVTSPYGMRVHPVTGVYKLHTGTDIAAPCETPVRAAQPGKVLEAGYDSAYGWRSVISSVGAPGPLVTTTYNHQARLNVKVGDLVTTGQVIGAVGTTGLSTGCHTHLELYVNTTLTDPQRWLPAR